MPQPTPYGDVLRLLTRLSDGPVFRSWWRGWGFPAYVVEAAVSSGHVSLFYDWARDRPGVTLTTAGEEAKRRGEAYRRTPLA